MRLITNALWHTKNPSSLHDDNYVCAYHASGDTNNCCRKLQLIPSTISNMQHILSIKSKIVINPNLSNHVYILFFFILFTALYIMYIIHIYPFPKVILKLASFIGSWRHLLEFNSNNNRLILKFMGPWCHLV